MSDTSLRFDFLKGRNTVSPEMRRVANDTRFMAGSIKASAVISVAATTAIGVGFAALGAHAVALTSAIGPVVGTIGLLPAAAVAVGAQFAAVKIATGGLSDALKEAAGSGGGAGAAIAAAEKRIAAAQREAKAAQDAINVARETAADRMRDLARTLAGAKLDEEGAVLAVIDAERHLRDVRRQGGSAVDIVRADLARRQSIQTLEEVRARLADVTKEQADAAKKGVEGSDVVQQALQHQRDAVQNLKDAQAAAKTAGGGGSNPAAEAYAKLSTAGKQLVDVIKVLRPQWAQTRNVIQQSTFAGVAGDLRGVAAVWLPMLSARLGGVGAGWNLAFRSSLGLVRSKGFVTDMGGALFNVEVAQKALARAFVPFLSGFKDFAVVGSSFLPSLAGSTTTAAQRFAQWAASARESGKMKEWISSGLGVMRQLWVLSRNLLGVIKGIFRAGSAGNAPLAGLIAGTAALRAFIDSAEGQEKIGQVFTTLRDIGSTVWHVMSELTPSLLNVAAAGGPLSDTVSVLGVVFSFLADHIDTFAKVLPGLAAGFVLVKTAQVASNLASVAAVPVAVLQVAANWGLRNSLNAHTVALRANTIASRVGTASEIAGTVATSAGDVAKKRSIASTILMRGAALASAAGTAIWTAAQWALNVALSPVGLIVIAIVAAVAALTLGIMYLWRNNEGFRKFVIGAWNMILGAIKFAWEWVKTNWPLLLTILTGPIGFAVRLIVGHWSQIKAGAAAAWQFVTSKIGAFLAWYLGIPGRMVKLGKNIFGFIVDAFKSAINKVLSIWNAIDFGISIQIPDWVPFGYGGKTFSIPDLFPDMPYLATGGTIRSAGYAMVGERGPEIVHLPAAARVYPHGTGPAAAGLVTLLIDSAGGRLDDLLLELLRRVIRIKGGDVQTALGYT